MDFPDPDEEFELMHADEMEMMDEMGFDEPVSPPRHILNPKSKRCLDFSNRKEGNESSQCNKAKPSENNDVSPLSKTLSPCDQPDEISVVNSDTRNISSTEGNCKRTLSDLFGDISDLDDDHISKKHRLTEEELSEREQQLMTIEKIVAERQRLHEVKILPRTMVSAASSHDNKKGCLSRRIPQWPFMPITDAKGDTIYARLYSEEYNKQLVAEVTKDTHIGGLLPVPYDRIKQIAVEQIQKKWDRIEAANQNRETNNDVIIEQENQSSELWVEKYQPRNYLQLLSDEGTNRALLQWLKLWDKIVFGRERKVRQKQIQEAKGRFGAKFHKKTGPLLNEELDEFGRPYHKVALLCGPPGLGKTTLAHMIAKQAGYNVVEVNSSDDRSPEIFNRQLEAATQMRSVMGEEPKPNCLVIDEIDGAPQASIEVLIKFVTAKGGTGGKTAVAKSRKSQSGAKGILKRPVICICNDVYVPALRSLRQIAFVLQFPPTSSARLAQRLMEIARLESLKTDLGVMMALSEKTGNDIRSCLSVLHCLKSQNGKKITLTQVNSRTLGQKDSHKGLFAVWQEIFQIQRHAGKGFSGALHVNDETSTDTVSVVKDDGMSLTSRMNSVLRTVQGSGDYERLAQGVYEHFLNMKLRDSTMKSVTEGLTWFCHQDLLSTVIISTQNYVLYPYLPYSFVMWHFLYAGHAWPKINFPNTNFEMNVRQNRYRQLLDEVLHGMQPTVRAYVVRGQILLDIMPLLLDIIVPNIRPVNIQLYTAREKEDLFRVVNTMIDYNLTYTQERTLDGSYIFHLDPNMEDVCKFNINRERGTLSYAGKQLIAREIDLEKVRRIEMSVYRNSEDDKNLSSTVPKKDNNRIPTVTTPKSPAVRKRPPQATQNLTPKAVIKPVDVVTKDFFGRIVETSLAADKQKAKTDEIIKSDIWFHFKEGYNNAVRRTIYMKDLL